jgi:hypothetical protein
MSLAIEIFHSKNKKKSMNKLNKKEKQSFEGNLKY